MVIVSVSAYIGLYYIRIFLPQILNNFETVVWYAENVYGVEGAARAAPFTLYSYSAPWLFRQHPPHHTHTLRLGSLSSTLHTVHILCASALQTTAWQQNWVQKTRSCKTRSSAPEDGQKIA
jgi:hypothetical protein